MSDAKKPGHEFFFYVGLGIVIGMSIAALLMGPAGGR